MIKLFKAITAISVSIGSIVSSQAAHWKLLSEGDATIPASYTTGNGVTRGARTSFSLTLPSVSSDIYGVGPFTFYGESDQYHDNTLCGESTLYTYTASANNYYSFKFQWVSDSPSDTPPSPNQAIGAVGYSLESGGGGQFSYLNPVYKTGNWSFLWDSQGPSLSPPYSPFSPATSCAWPVAGGANQVTVTNNGVLLYVRPVALGGVTVTLDGSGNTIGTMSVLNAQSILMVTQFSPYGNPSNVTALVYDNATMFGYLACAEIGGLKVTNS